MSSGAPSNLPLAAAAGVGVIRQDFSAGSANDAAVAALVAMHLRPYALLELPASHGAVADAAQMASFVTSFAQRYGPGGSFWSENPQLPYLPVLSFEIGNEPDAYEPPPAASFWAQYDDPAAYASVYETARTALHRVDPTGRAVVGGMLDSGAIPLSTVERYLAALGPMDAVGFHPYLYDPSLMKQDTVALRLWLNRHGYAKVALDVNEFDSLDGYSPNISAWGRTVAAYTEWALCTPALNVENVQPFWWGASPDAGSAADPWYPLTGSDLQPTPLGRDYLGEVAKLTTHGCPAPPNAPQRVRARAASGAGSAPVHRRRRRHRVRALRLSG